jgi:hypothetical protein
MRVKRQIVAILLTVLLFAFTACSTPTTSPTVPQSSTQTQQTTAPPAKTTPVPKIQLTNENWNLVLAEAQGAQKAYIGSPVTLVGKVGQVMTRTGTETQIAIDTTFEEITFGQRTAIIIPKDFNVKEGNYVKVEGILDSYWNTKSLIGAEMKVPIVVADTISIISRSQAIPPIVTVNVGKTVTQGGLAITLDKVEIASSETRLYIKASNGSSSKASLYSYDAVLVQGQKQIKVKTLLQEDITEPDTTLISGTATEGIIMFEPLDSNAHQAKLVWSNPRTDDWNVNFSDWVWEFTW